MLVRGLYGVLFLDGFSVSIQPTLLQVSLVDVVVLLASLIHRV